jgi:glycosyltransferase involved in cell wall biosynthesis
MGPKQKPKSIINGKFYPMVSVCTPTFNRRPFIPIMFECFKNQTYPMSRIEWIIVDDGTDKIEDLVNEANIPQIKYFKVDKKMKLGEKRNYMHSHVTGSIIVYMDDDDYYPPERISHAVERLTQNRDALCAGSSEIYIYFKHIKKMYQAGPYGPNHATAGTFAFRVELLKKTKYNENASLAEEKEFLKDYTIPFVQLDPMKTILVFSHEHNTFDKRKLLENTHPDYFRESSKTVDMFIKDPKEAHIKKYFMVDIEEKLKNYKPGEPIMKPDVLKQIKEIEKEREATARKMAEEQMKNGGGQMGDGVKIMMNRAGEPPREMNLHEIAQTLQNQQQHIETLEKQLIEKSHIIAQKDNELVKLKVNVGELNTKISGLLHKLNTVEKNPKSLDTPANHAITIDKTEQSDSNKKIIMETAKTEPLKLNYGNISD